MLPWYGTGRLTEAEAARVEAWLERHPEARRQVGLVAEERGETVARNEAAPTPRPGAAERLLARVAAERRPRRAGIAAGLLRQLGDWLEAMSPGMRGALAAAAVLLVIGQAAVIGVMTGREPVTFETASGQAPTAAPAQLLVAFAPEATVAEIAGLLAELDARIVDGPRPGNLFAVAIPESADPDEAVAMLAARQDLVTFAAPGSAQ